MEIHVYYKGGITTDKLKAISLPILVCRPILGAPIPTLPQPIIAIGGQMMIGSGSMPGPPLMALPPLDMVSGIPVNPNQLMAAENDQLLVAGEPY